MLAGLLCNLDVGVVQPGKVGGDDVPRNRKERRGLQEWRKKQHALLEAQWKHRREHEAEWTAELTAGYRRLMGIPEAVERAKELVAPFVEAPRETQPETIPEPVVRWDWLLRDLERSTELLKMAQDAEDEEDLLLLVS